MRPELPTGTVTFLFTDIEGSTRLLHSLGPDAYADALADHRSVLRDAFAAHGGVEVDTQGDAFFVAFPTADGAASAALAVGTTSPVRPRWRAAAMAIDSAPRVGRVVPSSANSPTTA